MENGIVVVMQTQGGLQNGTDMMQCVEAVPLGVIFLSENSCIDPT
jgi:hypothetical protein